jgi:hypothetical protein
MIRNLLTAMALWASVAAPACASEAAPKDPPKEAGQYVDLSPVALPIIIDGRLLNYVFVTARINLTSSANVVKLRTREPYFRDALIRAAHRTPFVKPGDYMSVDEKKLRAALFRDAVALSSAQDIASVVVTSQTPKSRRITGLPKAKPAGGELNP